MTARPDVRRDLLPTGHPSACGGREALAPSRSQKLIKSAIRTIAADPECGEPLKRELDGLRKYHVRRFRIVYAVHQKTCIIRPMAVGHRRSVYEELTKRLRRKAQE